MFLNEEKEACLWDGKKVRDWEVVSFEKCDVVFFLKNFRGMF